jgi:hypothetical protein
VVEAENEDQLAGIGDTMYLDLASDDCQQRDIDTGYRYSLANISQSKNDEDPARLQEPNTARVPKTASLPMD